MLGNDERAGNGGGTPCGEYRTVNGADIIGAEQVGQEGRDGREPTAIHGEDEKETGFEKQPFSARSETRNEQEEHELQCEEDEVGVAAPNEIGTGRPDETAASVEEADDGHHAAGREWRFLKEVLHHGRGLRQNADACGYVDEQDAPQQIELGRADGLVAVDAVMGDEFGDGRIPLIFDCTTRLPA